MRVVQLNSNNIKGGSQAVYRLHQALRDRGLDSRMLVQYDAENEPDIDSPDTTFWKAVSRVRPRLDKLPLHIYDISASEYFSLAWVPDRIYQRIGEYDPDIVQLNWINNGFLQIESLSEINVPIVWRLADMWPFTGGCHYTQGCTRFRDSCGKCPQLGSNWSLDASRLTWSRKNRVFEGLDLTVVATTSWMAEQAQSSSLFNNVDVHIIPNGLNTNTYRPIDQEVAREMFGIDQDKQVVLFGAVNATDNFRKGYDLLQSALSELDTKGDTSSTLAVVFGSKRKKTTPTYGLDTKFVGKLYDDEALAALYSAADVMTVPSRQEAFGQTASEALACGTPVVTFDKTGTADIIAHRETGYIADSADASDLACGIKWVLSSPERLSRLSELARKRAVKTYSQSVVARQYEAVYNEITS